LSVILVMMRTIRASPYIYCYVPTPSNSILISKQTCTPAKRKKYVRTSDKYLRNGRSIMRGPLCASIRRISTRSINRSVSSQNRNIFRLTIIVWWISYCKYRQVTTLKRKESTHLLLKNSMLSSGR
jgi:hypothetical protein